MDVWYSSGDSLRWRRVSVQAARVQRFIKREGVWHGGDLRNVLVAVNARGLKMTKVCARTCSHAHVCEMSFLQPEPIRKAEALAVQMCLSLSPTWNIGNGLFDHYLPVSLPSTGTTCYYCWCAAMTGQGHSHKLNTHQAKRKKEKGAPLWVWMVSTFKLFPMEV